MEIAHPAERPTATAREPGSQPGMIDHLLLFFGIAISAMLAHMTDLKTKLPEGAGSASMQTLLDILPTVLFLPVGVILFWPLFYGTQWLSGRARGLSAGEWLIGLAWLAAIAFAGWCLGKGTATLPEFLTDDDFKKYVVLGYILFMVSMGALALVIWLVGLVARWQQPWTHTLGIALMIWPAMPLLVIWLGNFKLE